MAVDTTRYGKRAADAERRLKFQMDSAGDLSAAVNEINEDQRRRREEAEKRKRGEQADALAVNERTYQRGRETASDARASRAEEAQTAERTAKQKRLDDEAAMKAKEAKRSEAVEKAAGLQGGRGVVSRSELEALGAGADMGPDELLAALDKINQEAFDKGQKAKGEAGLKAAQTKAAEALAKQRSAPKPGPRPMSPEAKRLQDARLREAEAKAKIAERQATGGPGSGVKPDKPKLTPAEVEGVVVLQGARSLLGQLEKLKTEGNIDTGPIANAVDWMRSKVGVGDPKRVEFKAVIGTQIAEYIKSISGATVSEPERAQLLQNVPTAGDDDEEFMAKLASVKRLLDNKLAAKKKAFAATGRDVAIFDETSGDDEFDSLPD